MGKAGVHAEGPRGMYIDRKHIHYNTDFFWHALNLYLKIYTLTGPDCQVVPYDILNAVYADTFYSRITVNSVVYYRKIRIAYFCSNGVITIPIASK